jgi:hypothetical protein
VMIFDGEFIRQGFDLMPGSGDSGGFGGFWEGTKLEQPRPFWLRLFNRAPQFSFEMGREIHHAYRPPD